MTSPLNLTAAKVRRLLLVTALVICPFLGLQNVSGQTATGTLTSGGMTSINITGGQSFTLSLAININFTSAGYTVFYQTGANGIGLFQAVARTNDSPINSLNSMPYFNDPTTDDFTAFFGTAGVLNQGPGGASNGFDLGYTSPGNPLLYAPAGMYTLQTITFNTLNAAPGTYTIFLDPRSIVTQYDGVNFIDVPLMANSFTINVIPEPATVGLAVVGGAVLLVAGLRRRRAQA